METIQVNILIILGMGDLLSVTQKLCNFTEQY